MNFYFFHSLNFSLPLFTIRMQMTQYCCFSSHSKHWLYLRSKDMYYFILTRNITSWDRGTDSSQCYCAAQINTSTEVRAAIEHDMQPKSGVHFRRIRARAATSRISYVTTEIADARKPREIASVRASRNEARARCCTCWHATALRSCVRFRLSQSRNSLTNVNGFT